MGDFGAEFIDEEVPPKWIANNQYLFAKFLLYQSGSLKEFGRFEQGDQVEILSMQVNIDGIKIIAKFGNEEKTFYLRAIRTACSGDWWEPNEKENCTCSSSSSSSSSSSMDNPMPRIKEKKPKRGFLDGYKTYNPNEEGYGSPEEWRGAFFERLGFDKANEVLGDEDPLTVLGITSAKPTWEEIENRFRRLILSCHPDRNPDNEEALAKSKKVIAAFEVLERRYKPNG